MGKKGSKRPQPDQNGMVPTQCSGLFQGRHATWDHCFTKNHIWTGCSMTNYISPLSPSIHQILPWPHGHPLLRLLLPSGSSILRELCPSQVGYITRKHQFSWYLHVVLTSIRCSPFIGNQSWRSFTRVEETLGVHHQNHPGEKSSSLATSCQGQHWDCN